MVIECYKNQDFRRLVNDADVVAPDGKPLSVFLQVFNGQKQEKVSGPDVFIDVLKHAGVTGKKVFFFGSTNHVLEKVVRRVQHEFPELKIAGTYSPPFRDLLPEEKKQIIDTINLAVPHFVFVALGCPKQEKWMAENQGKINACMLGVGQAFQIYAHDLKRSPKWLQDIGLEWAYRLCLEPGRLWKRYLHTNSLFLYLTIKYCIRNIFKANTLEKIN